MTNDQMSLDYYKSASRKTGKPRYVPKRIVLNTRVRSDLFITPVMVAMPGEYDAHCNPYGAVCVDTPSGRLGVKLDEFEVIEWQENEHR